MELVVALTIGLLVAAGIFRLLGKSKVDRLVGLLLLSQAANLTIFSSGGLRYDAPALLGSDVEAAAMADPLPQALVLTAIVIGFGILAFLLALITRSTSE
jgi:multicomponent Na+:H+ antiporter subunit C